MTVAGSGSSINQTLAGANLTIGAPSGSGTSTLNVDNGGVFTTGTGTTTIHATGTLNAGVISNGTFNANGNVNVDGGTINGGDSEVGDSISPLGSRSPPRTMHRSTFWESTSLI